MRIFRNRNEVKELHDKELIRLVVQDVAQRLKTEVGVEELVQYLQHGRWMRINFIALWREIPENEKCEVYNSLKTRFEGNELLYITAAYKI